MLFGPDFVVKFLLNTLKRTIRLVRILNNKRSLKFILEFNDEFWEEM